MSYDPTIGRWTSEDPIAFKGGDPNFYRYVGNQPDSYTDPTGKRAFRPFTPPQNTYIDGLKSDLQNIIGLAVKCGLLNNQTASSAQKYVNSVPYGNLYIFPDDDGSGGKTEGLSGWLGDDWTAFNSSFFGDTTYNQVVTLLHEGYHHGANYWPKLEPEGSKSPAENFAQNIAGILASSPCLFADWNRMNAKNRGARPGNLPAPFPPPIWPQPWQFRNFNPA